jgi:hypothetical protein
MSLYLDDDLTNADWTKTTLDLPVENVDELRAWLAARSWPVEELKKLPAYRLALDSGRYPWLADL